MLDRNRLLAGLRAVLQIAEAVVADLAPLFARQVHPRSAQLLQPGQVWSAGLLIESGLVRMHFLRRDGREFNKNFFTKGSLICPITPSMWIEPSLFGITCIEPSSDLALRCCALARGARPARPLGAHAARTANRPLTGKLQREHDLLALSGRQRYEAFCRQFPALSSRVPLLHLATYLGLTDVSLSRLRREMRDHADAAGPGV